MKDKKDLVVVITLVAVMSLFLASAGDEIKAVDSQKTDRPPMSTTEDLRQWEKEMGRLSGESGRIRQEWLKSDPLAIEAFKIGTKYTLWYAQGGAHERRLLEVDQKLRDFPLEQLAAWRVVHVEERIRLEADPDFKELVAFQGKRDWNKRREDAARQRWRQAEGYSISYRLPPKEEEQYLEDPEGYLKKLKWKVYWEERKDKLPEGYLAWLAKAVAADLKAILAREYRQHGSDSKLAEVNARIKEHRERKPE